MDFYPSMGLYMTTQICWPKSACFMLLADERPNNRKILLSFPSSPFSFPRLFLGFSRFFLVVRFFFHIQFG